MAKRTAAQKAARKIADAKNRDRINEKQRAYYAVNTERMLAHAAKYRNANRAKFNACAKRSREKNPYYQSEEYKKLRAEYVHTRRREKWAHVRACENKSRQKHLEKNQARNRAFWKSDDPRVLAYRAVTYAVQSGKMPRVETLQCRSCKVSARHYHHHNGYSQEHWFDVVPMCTFCHKAEHKRLCPVERTHHQRPTK